MIHNKSHKKKHPFPLSTKKIGTESNPRNNLQIIIHLEDHPQVPQVGKSIRTALYGYCTCFFAVNPNHKLDHLVGIKETRTPGMFTLWIAVSPFMVVQIPIKTPSGDHPCVDDFAIKNKSSSPSFACRCCPKKKSVPTSSTSPSPTPTHLKPNKKKQLKTMKNYENNGVSWCFFHCLPPTAPPRWRHGSHQHGGALLRLAAAAPRQLRG